MDAISERSFFVIQPIQLCRRALRRFCALLGIGLLGTGYLAAAPNLRAAEEPIRGVIISCQTWGYEWGTDAMMTALAEVKALGANWVQIHPYGSIDREGNISLRHESPDDGIPPWLSRPIQEAHRLGLKIAVVPHLAGWRAGWSWRGEIGFQTEEQWRRFFTSYESWIGSLAAQCREADGFSVGSELDRTIPNHEAQWRSIIRAVRASTPAALTYGANWSDYRAVPFWDAVDAIGISAYFPLTEDEAPPHANTLDAAWGRLHHELSVYARAQNRRVVFMELGYDQSTRAALEPWVSGRQEPGSATIQALCLDRALVALDQAPGVAGAFLWKWFPGESPRENFRLQSPAMKAVIRQRWGLSAQPFPPTP